VAGSLIAMLDRLCADAHHTIFILLVPLELAALRSCTRALHARLSPADARAVWLAAGRRSRLPELFLNLPTAQAAAMFTAIWPTAITTQRPAYFAGALRHACERQWVSKARWLLTNGRVRAMSIWHGADSTLAHACSHGHTGIVELLITTLAIPLNRLMTGHRHHIHGKTRARTNRFRDACAGGHLATAQWLAAHFKLEYAECRGGLVEALDSVGVSGHLAVAQWLIARFPFQGYELIALLINACKTDQCELATWLIRSGRADLQPDHQGLKNRLMCDLCALGHTAIAQELARHCALASDAGFRQLATGATAFEPYFSAWDALNLSQPPPPTSAVMNWLLIACRARHFATADWLVAEFELKGDRVLCEVYRAADYNEISPITHWLLRRFTITVRELNSMRHAPSPRLGFYRLAKK
jgi:hypothetical protein